MSIINSEPPASGAADLIDITRTAYVPAAAFIVVEILLAAETISALLLDELTPRNPGAGLIALLLTIALLVNLGVVCTVAAANAAVSVGRRHLVVPDESSLFSAGMVSRHACWQVVQPSH